MSKLSKDYLLYTFSIMIVCWGIFLICSLNGMSLESNYFLFIPYLVGGWSPTIASYIVLKKNSEVKDLKDWMKNVFDFKHNMFSYIMVVTFGVLYILPQCLISGYENGAPLFAIVAMIPMMLVMGGLEEAGWRYILQPELEKKYNYFVSTITVSVIWWLWHFLLFYIQGEYGQNYFVFGIEFIAFGINILGVSFALASIKKNTNSVWLCILLHCIVNSLSGIYVINDNIIGNIVATVVLTVVSLIFVKINNYKKIFN